MSIRIPRGKSDAIIERIIEALKAYEADHPEAVIDIYRRNSFSVRVRIIAPVFAGMSNVERSKKAWQDLDALTDDDQSDISSLVLLTPEETGTSISNIKFENPSPSMTTL